MASQRRDEERRTADPDAPRPRPAPRRSHQPQAAPRKPRPNIALLRAPLQRKAIKDIFTVRHDATADDDSARHPASNRSLSHPEYSRTDDYLGMNQTTGRDQEIRLYPWASYRRAPKGFHSHYLQSNQTRNENSVEEPDERVELELDKNISLPENNIYRTSVREDDHLPYVEHYDDDYREGYAYDNEAFPESDDVFRGYAGPHSFDVNQQQDAALDRDAYPRKQSLCKSYSGPRHAHQHRQSDIEDDYQDDLVNHYGTYRRAPRTYPRLDVLDPDLDEPVEQHAYTNYDFYRNDANPDCHVAAEYPAAHGDIMDDFNDGYECQRRVDGMCADFKDDQDEHETPKWTDDSLPVYENVAFYGKSSQNEKGRIEAKRVDDQDECDGVLSSIRWKQKHNYNELVTPVPKPRNGHKPATMKSSINDLFPVTVNDIAKKTNTMKKNINVEITRSKSSLKRKLNSILGGKKRAEPSMTDIVEVKETNIDTELDNVDLVADTRTFPKPFFYCRWITSYPKLAFMLTLGGHLLVVIATVALLLSGYDLFPTEFETLPMSDWNVPWLKRDFAWRFRDQYEGRYIRKLFLHGIDKWYRSMAYGRANIVLYYDTNGGNIFQKSKLKRMQYIEDKMVHMKSYSDYCVLTEQLKCEKPTSILRYFDGTYADVDPVFNDTEFNNIAEVLNAAQTNNITKPSFAYFLSKDHAITSKIATSPVTRTIIPMGYPLKANQKLPGMEEEMKQYLVANFKPLVENLKDKTHEFTLIYFSYLLFRHDIVIQIFYDAMFAVGSVLFIFCFIVYHTKSLFISTFSVMSILTSFLAANLVYRIVFDFRYFGFFHVIAIFIILGIGADDLFVFLDVWKDTGFTRYPSLAHRLSEAYKNSVLSMFFTSLTTTVAFFASAFSPLLAPKSFGVFAGILVVVNYLSVITYFPTVTVMHHLYFKNWSWPCTTFVMKTLKNIVQKIKRTGRNRVSETPRQLSRRNSLFDDNTAVGSNGHAYNVVANTNPAFKADPNDEYGFMRLGGGKKNKHKLNGIEHAQENNANKQVMSMNGHANPSLVNEFTEHEVTIKKNLKSTPSPSLIPKQKKILVRFFRDHYFRFVTHRVIRWIILSILGVVVVFFAYHISKLETENEQVQFYRRSHNYGHALDLDFHSFIANKKDRNVVLYIVWGLRERDMSVCHFSDGRCIGRERFDETFNPYTPDAQTALMHFCDKLQHLTSDEIEYFKIRRDFHTNVPEIKCFASDLNAYMRQQPGSNTDNWSLPFDYRKTITFMQSRSRLYDTAKFNRSFTHYLQIPISYWLNDAYTFKNTEAFETYHTLIGERTGNFSTSLRTDPSVLYGNEIAYLGVQVNLTLGTFTSGYPEGKPALDRWEKFIQEEMERMPPGMKNGFQLTKGFWHTVSVQHSMAENALLGIAIGIALALPILTIATQNFIIGFFATFSMCCSTACVVGVIPLVGWKLGILESLNMCMVVGLSVDYVVHLAEGYHMSKHSDRKSRVRDMLEVMGISVFSGACTTLGASIFMIFAQIQFLIRFGIFMFCTIGFSLLFSLGFFTTLMGILGPSGDTGNIRQVFERLFPRCRKRESPGIHRSSIEEDSPD